MYCYLCGAENQLMALECRRCGKPAGLGVGVRPLTEALERPEFDVHTSAAKALGCYPDESLVAIGRDFLARDLDRFEFPAAAAIALGSLDDEGSKATAAIFAAEKLGSGDRSYPWDVALQTIRYWPDRAVEWLLRGLDGPGADPFAEVDLRIAEVLAGCPHFRVTERMEALSASDDEYVLGPAYRQLVAFGNERQRLAASTHFRETLRQLLEGRLTRYAEHDIVSVLKALGASASADDRDIAIRGLLRLCKTYDRPMEASEALCGIADFRMGLVLAEALPDWPFGHEPANQVYQCAPTMAEEASSALCIALAENAAELDTNGLLNAVNVWGNCGFVPVRAGLMELLPRTDGVVRLEVRDALAKLGDPACVAEVCEEALAPPPSAFETPEIYMRRRSALDILGQCCEPEVALMAIPALATGVTDDNEDLAEEAALAIGNIARRVRFPEVSI